MFSYIEILATILLIWISYILFSNKRPNSTKHLKTVPVVTGKLPYVGHGIVFSKDIIGFVSDAYKKYGPIFRIKVFNKDIIVVCDRKMIPDFFKATENNMSLYSILDNLYFSDAFCDSSQELSTVIKIVKSTVSVKFDVFVPKIKEQAEKLINGMKKKAESGEKFKLSEEMIKFVACTSSVCFVGVEITPIYDILMKFTHLLNFIVVMTYFIPKSILRIIFNPFLRRYRRKITDFLDPIIEEYRKDPQKNDSMIIRRSVDYVDNIDSETKKSLTNREIGNIIVCLLYVSSENTALGLSSTVTDLAMKPEWWDKVKNITFEYLETGDYRGLLADTFFEAAIMESARMNTHIFALQRKPMDKYQQIGGYYVGDCDSVALCEPMLMLHDSSTDVFKDPLEYNPDRFLEPRNEQMDSKGVMTWGSGIHLCPGKLFAIYEIKIATALLLNNFDVILPKVIPPLDYFSPSAYAERNLYVQIKHAQHNTKSESQKSFETVIIDEVPVQVYDEEEQKGWLIRDFFTREQQEQIFVELYDSLDKNNKLTKEKEEKIMNAPKDKAYPFAFYNLVYTGESNIEKPENLLNIGISIWKLLESEIHKYYPDAKTESFNSMYSQLFCLQGKMAPHKDEYVDWGISISINASCDFTFGKTTIKLHSGDVFVSDFSKVTHSVDKINDNPPGWFNEENPNFKLYERTRCSIQIRDIKKTPDKIMNHEEFEVLVNS
jgi:cytochrome P450